MAIFLVITVWVCLSALFPTNSIFKNRFVSSFIVLMLIGLMFFYIPTWDVFVSDMVRYVAAFQNMQYLSLSQILQVYENWEPLFLVTQWFISRFTDNQIIYVLFTYTIFVVILFSLIRNLFLPWQRMFVMFMFLCYPFFYMYVFDGLRQGIAMLLIILAMSFWFRKRHSILFYITLISAGFFHDTAFLMAVIIYVTFLFRLKFRSLLLIWITSSFLFLTGLNTRILNFSFVKNLAYIQDYTGSELMGTFGGEVNKINFWIFTAFFLFVSLFLYNYIVLEPAQKEIYSLIIKCYIGFSSVFISFGFIAYSNRIAMYSWFLIPLLIGYPILYQRPHNNVLLFLVILLSFATSFIYSPFIVF